MHNIIIYRIYIQHVQYVHVFTVVYLREMYVKKIGKLCIYACIYVGITDETCAIVKQN